MQEVEGIKIRDGTNMRYYLEKYIEDLLENLKSENTEQLIRDLDAVRYEIFSLTIAEL